MKINSISQQNNNQSFRGKISNFIIKHPASAAALATSSVVAQKLVMSGSEAVLGPLMDVSIGRAITKATGEEDGRTNQSSKTQAIRTASQAIGGSVVGITIRVLSIIGCTMALSKAGAKAGSKIADVINPQKLDAQKDLYKFKENAAAWGRSVGGALSIGIMMFTNFLLDVPIVNHINKKITDYIDKKGGKKQAPAEQKKEVK